MNAKERIMTIRLSESIGHHPQYASDIGVLVVEPSEDTDEHPECDHQEKF